jgi:hypothetical protein
MRLRPVAAVILAVGLKGGINDNGDVTYYVAVSCIECPN